MGHRVVFICPHLDKAGKFHDQAHRYMQIAAEDLDLDLEAIDASASPDLTRDVAELLVGPEPPAGAVLVNSRNVGPEVLETLDGAGVHTVVAFEGFYQTDRSQVGIPGDPLRYWRAEILPDDNEVGRLLTETLIRQALSRGLADSQGRIRVLALSGPFTQAATNRLTGFREYVKGSEVEVIYDLQMADWSAEKGYRLTREHLEDQRPHVVWCANDSIATGALRALEEDGVIPGEEALVGGVDWLGNTLEKVRSGRMATSVGGHLLDGIWALVLVHDAIRGHPPPVERRITSSMKAATADDAASYQRLLDESLLRSVEFRDRFSATDGRYDFSLRRLLEG